MKSFRRLASLITNTPPATPPTRKPALVVERLETRDVPATFTVSTLADSGGGSLRQAVADANAAVGVDDVVFAPALAGQVVLTTGEIGITDGVNILGTGAGRVSVSGNNNSRIFYIDTAVARDDVLISGLTLTGGRARDVSAALGDGLDGGALYNVNADLTLQNCVITGNVSDDGAGGGVVHSGYGRLLVQSTVFTNNNSYGSGAGLYAGRGATSITIEDCTFSGNTAGIHGGAVYIRVPRPPKSAGVRSTPTRRTAPAAPSTSAVITRGYGWPSTARRSRTTRPAATAARSTSAPAR